MQTQQRSAASAAASTIARCITRRANELGLRTADGKPVKHTQALELVAAGFGERNRHIILAALKGAGAPPHGALEPSDPANGDTDYVLRDGYTSFWVRVANLAVYVKRETEGVVVDIWPYGRAMGESITSSYAMFDEALQAYTVMLVGPDGVEPIRFECLANDEAQARGQAMDAYPSYTIVSAELDDHHTSPPLTITQRREAVADAELLAYSFGEITAFGEVSSHWDTDGEHLLKLVSIEYQNDAGKVVTDQVSFHVVFTADTAATEDAYGLLMSSGAEIGERKGVCNHCGQRCLNGCDQASPQSLSSVQDDCGDAPASEFVNHYLCPCGELWQDTWSAMCNDRCPKCNSEIEPYYSEDTDDEGSSEGEREAALQQAMTSMDLFECDECGKFSNTADSVREDDRVICTPCQKKEGTQSQQ